MFPSDVALGLMASSLALALALLAAVPTGQWHRGIRHRHRHEVRYSER
jgi:hypothetical protein